MGAQDIFVSLYKEKGAQMGSKICSSWNWNHAQNGKFYFVSDIWIAHNQIIPWRTTVSVFFHFLIFPFPFWPLCRTYMWLGRQEVWPLSVGVLNSGISWQLHVLCKSGCKYLVNLHLVCPCWPEYAGRLCILKITSCYYLWAHAHNKCLQGAIKLPSQ